MSFHILDAPRFRSAELTSTIIERLPHIAPTVRPDFRAFLAAGIAAELVRNDIAISDGAILAALRGYQLRWPGTFSQKRRAR